MSEGRQAPLAGIRVLELAGLAPGPFAGMMLADHGADVLRVDRVAAVSDQPRTDVMDRGKHTIGLDLKSPEGVAALKDLAERRRRASSRSSGPAWPNGSASAPTTSTRSNPRLIYGRMTGWGQDGPLAPTAGTTSTTSRSPASCRCSAARATSRPRRSTSWATSPAAASCSRTACCCALFERERTGQGRVIDAAMVDGAAILFAMFYHGVQTRRWGPRGTNLLDTGAPHYDTYETRRRRVPGGRRRWSRSSGTRW